MQNKTKHIFKTVTDNIIEVDVCLLSYFKYEELTEAVNVWIGMQD